jgi:hypothetical protein
MLNGEEKKSTKVIYLQSKEKLKEQAVQETKELEELKAKKAVINFDIQKVQQDLKNCIELNDVKPLRLEELKLIVCIAFQLCCSSFKHIIMIHTILGLYQF